MKKIFLIALSALAICLMTPSCSSDKPTKEECKKECEKSDAKKECCKKGSTAVKEACTPTNSAECRATCLKAGVIKECCAKNIENGNAPCCEIDLEACKKACEIDTTVAKKCCKAKTTEEVPAEIAE